MKTPYLVQRGSFRKIKQLSGIDALVQFDYMGSSEFEDGALPKALKDICAVISQIEIKQADIKTADGRELFLLCRAEDESALREFWQRAVKNRYDVRTKELLWYGGKDDATIGCDNTEFWWDVERNQCWIAVLGRNNAEDVIEALKAVKKKKGW